MWDWRQYFVDIVHKCNGIAYNNVNYLFELRYCAVDRKRPPNVGENANCSYTAFHKIINIVISFFTIQSKELIIFYFT